MNNLIQYVKEEKSINFSYGKFKGFFPRNWLPAIAVTSLEGKNPNIFKSIQQIVYVDGQKRQLKLISFFHLASIRKALLQGNTHHIST